MKTFLVLSITALISQVLGYVPRPQQQWGNPEEQQWGPPEQQWGSPEQDQWGGPPQSNPSPEWYPRPQYLCDQCIPKSAETDEITPIVVINVTYVSIYPCDSTSRVKRIQADPLISDSPVTCNGKVVNRNDRTYDLVYADTSSTGEQKVTVTLTNYTRIITYNNGNLNHIECGTIANGRCAGDIIFGTRIAQANDQTGCCKGGNTGNVAIYRLLEIKGKCKSRCSLGRSTHTYSVPVSNRGLAVRALEKATPKPLIH